MNGQLQLQGTQTAADGTCKLLFQLQVQYTLISPACLQSLDDPDLLNILHVIQLSYTTPATLAAWSLKKQVRA